MRELEIDTANVSHSGNTLSGKGMIHWQHGQPSDMEYSCYFDSDGRVTDSSYRYF